MFAFQLLLASVVAAASFFDAREVVEAAVGAETNGTEAKFEDEYYSELAPSINLSSDL